jgi:hypothetical protein
VLPLITATLACALPVPADTVVLLGRVERDLTGDGRAEVLRLVGEGSSVDILGITFTIESAGTVVFRAALAPLTRTVGLDAGRRELSAAEHQARLEEFGSRFFAECKFKRPDEFVEWLRRSAPGRVARIPAVIDRDRRRQAVVDSLVATGRPLAEAEERARYLLGGGAAPVDTATAARSWEEIRRAGVSVFEFSEGGDAVTAIAWSARDRRFYRLFECC